MSRLFLRGIEDKRGQSTVEFALVLPVLLLIVFGIIEFGFILNAYVTVISSAREGARYGITGDIEEDQIIQRVKNAAGMLDTTTEGKFSVTVNKNEADGELTVAVTYNVDILDPIMGAILGATVPVNAKITMAMEPK